MRIAVDKRDFLHKHAVRLTTGTLVINLAADIVIIIVHRYSMKLTKFNMAGFNTMQVNEINPSHRWISGT